MRVTVHDAAPSDGGVTLYQPLEVCSSITVEPSRSWTVADVLEAAGLMRFRAFSLATPEIESDVSAGADSAEGLIHLFGVESDGTMRFHQHDNPLSWKAFLRATDQSLYRGDRTRIAVYGSGVAGGPEPEFLDQAVTYLLSGAAGALAGAVVSTAREQLMGIGLWRKRRIAENLRKRGFTGPLLFKMLRRYPQWTQKQLQDLLELEDEEARLMLTNAGYKRSDDDGLWRADSSWPGEKRREAMDQIEDQAHKDF